MVACRGNSVAGAALCSGWRCIAEYEGSTPAMARKFIFGTYLDEPLALIDVDTSETIFKKLLPSEPAV
jgi:hypothetical protein